MTTIITILIFLSSYLQNDYFEGGILYDHEFTSSTLDLDSLKAAKSFRSAYIFKNKYYKGFTFTSDTLFFIYDGESARCLYSRSSQDDVYCYDYSVPDKDDLKSWRILDEERTILGHRCKILEFQYNDYLSKYYFTTELKLDPRVYKTHIAYDYKKRLELTDGGVTLLSEHIYGDYTMSIRATKVSSFEVPMEEFQIELFDGCK